MCRLVPFALDIDPDRDSYLATWPRVVAWLDRMRRAHRALASRGAMPEQVPYAL